MIEFLFILPIVLAISFVLGACRARTTPGILIESARTFGRIVAAMVLVILVLQGVLWAIPRVF